MMGNAVIQQDELEELNVKLTNVLDAIKTAKGQKVDHVKELCDLVGISKQSLAAGIIWISKGDITIVELAEKLHVGRATIYRWPDILNALKKSIT